MTTIYPLVRNTRCQIETITASDIDAGLRQTWRQLQAGAPMFRSPFFSVEFVQIVAATRQDVEIALLRDDNQITGFFPFHRRPGRRGAPLAAPIADYQGILGKVPEAIAPSDLLVACGLTHYDFDHALRDAPMFHANAFRHIKSPLIDLSDGMQRWLDAKRKAGSAIKNVERKLRKMERELGPIRFEPNDCSQEAWTKLLEWKRAALAAKGVRFILDEPWAMETLERARSTHETWFSGRLSTLYAGDRLVAAHFGICSHAAWHWWFPTYDTAASRYTPGLALLLNCVRQAAEEGLAEVDLGRGDERYKQEFSNGARALCEGSLELGMAPLGAARRFRKLTYRAAERILPPRYLDLQRRAVNRLLKAGRI